MILIAFENDVFPLPKQYLSEHIGDWKDDKMDSTHLDKHDKIQESKPEESDDLDDLDRTISENGKTINKKLFKKYFKYDSLGDMQENLFMTKGKPCNMTMDRLITEKPFKVVNTVARILNFNKQNQEGQGLKILTPQ